MVDESVLVLMGINILMGWSFFVIQLSGQFSFGNAGFMALGAYASGVATVKLGLPYPVGLAIALVLGAAVGCLVGFPALRLRGVYLALATIGFAFLVEDLFVNLDYTGAQVGFYGLQGTTLGVVYATVLVVGLLLLRLQQSRLAHSLQAVREQEVVAGTLGLNATYLKVLSFAFGAALASLAGALYGHYLYFISPELFGFFQSILPAFYVALGGRDTVLGPLLGAAVVTLLPEEFQPLKEWRLLVFALAVMLLAGVRPEGLYTARLQRRLFGGLMRAPRLLGLLVLVLAGCTPAAPVAPTAPPAATSAPAAAQKPTGASLKVGFIVPLSGAVASYGEGVKYAPALALKKINDAGGVNGAQVELVTCDSPNNPNQAITCLRKLANDDKVVAVVGPYYTGEMQAVVPILKDVKIPVIAYTPAASYPGLVEQSDWAVLAGTDELSTVSMAVDGYKRAYPNVQKMVVVGDTQTAVTALTIKDVWPKVLPEKGMQILDTLTFQFATTDFGPIATRIKAAGADGIALSALSPAGPNLLQELERQGVKLPVVTSSHLQTVPPLPKILGTTANGLVQTMFFTPDELQKPAVRAWAEEYQAAATAGNPGADRPPVGYANEAQAYDAFGVTLQAMKDAGVRPDTALPEARDKVRQALHAIKQYPGVLQPKDITPQGRITWDQWPLIAQDGAYQPIK
jgi:branched-chain amino acid transport system permease protein